MYMVCLNFPRSLKKKKKKNKQKIINKLIKNEIRLNENIAQFKERLKCFIGLAI